METLLTILQDGISHAGLNWAIAVAGSFVIVLFESAKPKTSGEQEKALHPLLGFVLSVANLAPAVLLILHAFWSNVQSASGGADFGMLLLQGFACIGMVVGAVLAAMALGGIVAAVAPAWGRAVQLPMQVLTLPVFAFTLWVTWSSALTVLQLYVFVRFGIDPVAPPR